MDHEKVGVFASPQPRRSRTLKRPRFLMRRRTGSMGVAMRIEGAEIIARR